MKFKNKILILLFILILSLQTIVFADEVDVNSKAAILVEVSTGRILYEKNSTKQMYPASTTKIMTAILVLEKCQLTDMVKVTENALNNIPSGYVRCDLQVGEEISVKDLLYALMVKSANDAAYVLAEHVGGTVDAFADMMNIKAREIGCTGTHFVNPNGIHDDKHYSTAYDLYIMGKYGMENETFRKLVSTTSYTLPATNKYPNTDRELKTTNELLNSKSSNYYKNAIGIKTGYTSQSGECLVAQSSRDGLQFITVVLDAGVSGTGLRFKDSKKLFDYAYDNYTLTKIKEKNTVVTTIAIENANKETRNLDLLIDDSITIVNNKSLNVDQIIPEIILNDNLSAPILQGSKVGTIKYKVDDIEYSANLVAASEVVPRTNYSVFIIMAGILLLIIAYSILRKNKLKRKRK